MEVKPYRVNLDFESRLLERETLNTPINEWDSIFFFLSKSDECLVSDKVFSSEFLSFLKTEWGLTPQTCPTGEDVGDWWGKTDDLKRERFLNSKIHAREFCLWAKRDEDFPSRVVNSAKELEVAFAEVSKISSKVLLKAPYGFSGKGNLILSSTISFEKLQNKATSFCAENAPFLIEPWVKRCFDFRYRIIEDGVDQLAQTLIHPQGHFVGVTDLNEQTRSKLLSILGNSLAQEMKTFFGDHFPFQADGFFYQDPTGSTKVRQVSEFNHRRSLGEMLFRCRELSQVRNQKCSWIVVQRTKKYDSFYQLIEEIKKAGLKEEVFPTSDVSGQFLTFFVKTPHHSHIKILKALYLVLGTNLPAWLLNQFTES